MRTVVNVPVVAKVEMSTSDAQYNETVIQNSSNIIDYGNLVFPSFSLFFKNIGNGYKRSGRSRM